MFNLKTKLFLMAAVLVLGGFSAANAQINEGSSIKVNVPNAFTLRDQTFEAGIYTIERTPSTIDSPSLLVIRGENNTAMVFDTILARSNNSATATRLVFDTVGDTKFLTGIVVKGQSGMNEVAKTKAQTRKMAEGNVARLYLTINETNGF